MKGRDTLAVGDANGVAGRPLSEWAKRTRICRPATASVARAFSSHQWEWPQWLLASVARAFTACSYPVDVSRGSQSVLDR